MTAFSLVANQLPFRNHLQPTRILFFMYFYVIGGLQKWLFTLILTVMESKRKIEHVKGTDNYPVNCKTVGVTKLR